MAPPMGHWGHLVSCYRYQDHGRKTPITGGQLLLEGLGTSKLLLGQQTLPLSRSTFHTGCTGALQVDEAAGIHSKALLQSRLHPELILLAGGYGCQERRMGHIEGCQRRRQGHCTCRGPAPCPHVSTGLSKGQQRLWDEAPELPLLSHPGVHLVLARWEGTAWASTEDSSVQDQGCLSNSPACQFYQHCRQRLPTAGCQWHMEQWERPCLGGGRDMHAGE